MNKKVSIIIPVKAINDYIREAIPYLLELDYCDYEIIIFPDDASSESFPKTRIIPSGKVGPAVKRDMAIQHAEGIIFAFIDDDAYPRKDWLKNAIKYFDNESIGAVGGPAVTPESDDLWQQASGKVYESTLCSGQYTYRYLPSKIQDVDDLPSVNLIVRRDVFEKVGGFDLDYYPGEDTKLCLDITKKLGLRIIYDPDVFVWHHRRKLFKGHLKQIVNYALHRGYFVKKLPETSFKLSYFIPSIFVLGLLTGPVLGYALKPLWYFYSFVILLYMFLIIIYVGRIRNVQLALLTAMGIFVTHVGYGLYFIKGLFKKELIR